MLKDLREKLHITQKKLANDLGVSESTISLYEKNMRKPPISKIEKIAKILQTDEKTILKCFKKE